MYIYGPRIKEWDWEWEVTFKKLLLPLVQNFAFHSTTLGSSGPEVFVLKEECLQQGTQQEFS